MKHIPNSMRLTQYFFSCYLLSFVIVSCGNNNETSEISTQTVTKNNSVYGDTNYSFPEFSENARSQVQLWSVYEDFETEAKSLNGSTLDVLQVKSARLGTHIDSLVKKIPDTLFTQAIYSRVLVVKTRTNLLEQALQKSRIDSIQIQISIDELNVSIFNLIVQINEKIQKDAIDLRRISNEKMELENQRRFLDSVHQVELNDQAN